MRLNSTTTVALALAALCSVSAASAQVSPHVGHVQTSFRNTPDQKGFLETALAEADVAIQHAVFGMRDLTNLEGMKLHGGHVLHAVDPTLIEGGPGKGYGLKQAAANIASHIDMAGAAEDQPAAVTTHSVHVAASARNTVQRADEIAVLAQQLRGASTAEEAKPLYEALNAKVQQLRAGLDANNDGRVGWQEGEGGLDACKTHMDLMMRSL